MKKNGIIKTYNKTILSISGFGYGFFVFYPAADIDYFIFVFGFSYDDAGNAGIDNISFAHHTRFYVAVDHSCFCVMAGEINI